MKRRKTQLKSADKAGWYAEFPEELWGLILGFLAPNDQGAPDLPVLITLLGTCKMLVRLLRKPILTLLHDYMFFESDGRFPSWYDGKERFFCVIDSLCKTLQVNILDYMCRCTLDKTHQDAQHLSTSLSVMHLAYMEGRYLWDYGCASSSCKPIVYGISGETLYRVGAIRHYDKKTHKVTSLARLKGVGVAEMFTVTSLYNNKTSLHTQVVSLMRRTNNHEGLKTFLGATLNTKNIAAYMDLLVENGTQFATRVATVKDKSSHLVVTINGRQHSFYADAAAELRAECFIPGMRGTLQDNAYAYVLDSFHKRNWAIVSSILSDNARV